MRRHLMPLAAFFVEADPPALAVGEVVLDPHGDDGADAGLAIFMVAIVEPLPRRPSNFSTDDVRRYARDHLDRLIPIPDRFESNPTLASGVWIVATMPSPIQSDLEAVSLRRPHHCRASFTGPPLAAIMLGRWLCPRSAEHRNIARSVIWVTYPPIETAPRYHTDRVVRRRWLSTISVRIAGVDNGNDSIFFSLRKEQS
jgi:hypothetical protein